MAIARRPPRRSTSAAVVSASSVTQSHRRFEPANGTSSARWPIANFGVVPMPTSLPSRSIVFSWSRCSAARVVHCWPSGGTYWRGSTQIGHSGGGSSRSANWVPHATQPKRSMPRKPTYAYALDCGRRREALRRAQHVADAAHGVHDGARAGRGELAAQVPDVDAQRVGLWAEVVAPHAVVDDAVRQDRSRVAHEEIQQLE